MKKLTIITITYNNLAGLRDTLKSVFSQSCKDFEYLIIDGGSTDGSKEYLQENDDKIDYWVSEPDKGIYNAMNKGIAKANGEYLLFLNSGDSFYSNAVVEKVLPKLENDIDVVYGDLYLHYPQNSSLDEIKHLPDRITLDWIYRDTISHQAAFIRKVLFTQHGGYREDLKIVSDWEFFLKLYLLSNTTFRHVSLTIAKYTVDGLSFLQAKELGGERDQVINETFSTDFITELKMLRKYKKVYNYPIFKLWRNIKTFWKSIFKKKK